MRTLTIPEFSAALKAQGVSHPFDCAFVCPMCGTVQSTRDFIAAGDTVERAEGFIGFSCIGRRRPDTKRAGRAKTGEGCDWTLGGPLKFHRLLVVDGNGERHPLFELASADQARAHAEQTKAEAS